MTVRVSVPPTKRVRSGAVADGQVHADRGYSKRTHRARDVRVEQTLVGRILREVGVACSVRVQHFADLVLAADHTPVVVMDGLQLFRDPVLRERFDGMRLMGERPIVPPCVQTGREHDGQSADDEREGEQTVEPSHTPVMPFEPLAGRFRTAARHDLPKVRHVSHSNPLPIVMPSVRARAVGCASWIGTSGRRRLPPS